MYQIQEILTVISEANSPRPLPRMTAIFGLDVILCFNQDAVS